MDYKIHDAVFIDESSFTITDMKRYGYTVQGQEINNVVRHKHNKETLTAITAISVVAKEVIKGSVNGEVYRSFLEKHLDAFRNNARAHHFSQITAEHC